MEPIGSQWFRVFPSCGGASLGKNFACGLKIECDRDRGLAGMVPFAMTFMLIALMKAVQLRRLGAVTALARALLNGMREGGLAPEEWMPEGSTD